MRDQRGNGLIGDEREFPFLFGGTFIEGFDADANERLGAQFPFLFGGTFIEGVILESSFSPRPLRFPFLFGGTFIEGAT